MGNIDLDAIDKRCNEAQPIETWERGTGIYYADGAFPHGPYTRDERQAKADKEFIKHARRDLPTLVHIVRRLTDEAKAAAVYAYDAGARIARAQLATVEHANDPPSELSYNRGHRMALRGMLGFVIGGLFGDGEKDPYSNALLQLADARIALRAVCANHGDNDWPDTLNLGDVIAKHLARHLDARCDAVVEHHDAEDDADFDEVQGGPCTCEPRGDGACKLDPNCPQHGPL